MTEQTYNQLSDAASEKLSEVLPADYSSRMRRDLAAETVRAEMAAMEAAGKVLKLTDEEIRLLRSFRRFKTNVRKAGEIFKWQTVPAEEGRVLIMSSADSCLISDPLEVLETVRVE